LGANVYYDAGGWKYKADGAAQTIGAVIYGGNPSFNVSMAPSGAAGTAANLVAKFTVDANGNCTAVGSVIAAGVRTSAGMSCGSPVATGVDLSRHITLYDPGFGLNVTSGTTNVVAGSVAHAFTANGLALGGTTLSQAGGQSTPTFIQDTNQAGGTQHALSWTTNGVMHWQVRDSLATYAFAAFNDAGAYLGDALQLDRAGRIVYIAGPSLYPRTDNATVISAGSLRFSAVYAVTGTIQTSDARMKKDIADSTLGLSFIESLRPVSYKWIVGKNIAEPTGDGSDVDAPLKVTPLPGVRTHWGLIAQEVQQAVTAAGVDFGGYIEEQGNADAPLGLNYSEFIAPLIKAVQELSARVRELEARP
jgi:hypothetical protein